MSTLHAVTQGRYEMTFGEFIKARVGDKWVLTARRTARIDRQYPGSVVVTPKRYREMQKEYREQFGDPDDAVRAELYLALRELVNCADLDTRGMARRLAILRAQNALVAEAKAK